MRKKMAEAVWEDQATGSCSQRQLKYPTKIVTLLSAKWKQQAKTTSLLEEKQETRLKSLIREIMRRDPRRTTAKLTNI